MVDKVFGNMVQSERVFIGDKLYISLKWRSEDFVERFRPGDTVNVFYNPEKPNESVLIKGPLVSSYLFAILGIVMCVMAVVIHMSFYMPFCI